MNLSKSNLNLLGFCPKNGGHYTPNEMFAEKLLKDKITKHIYLSSDEGEDQKKYRLQNLFLKMESVKQLLADKNSIDNFYQTIYQSPADILINELESKHASALADEYISAYLT